MFSASKRSRTESEHTGSRSPSPSVNSPPGSPETPIERSTIAAPLADSPADVRTSHSPTISDSHIRASEAGAALLAAAGAQKRSSIDTLCRIFPHKKRSVLHLILQGCNGDLVQSIEQVLSNNHLDNQVSIASPISATSLLTNSPYFTSPLSSSTLKSAFSPITGFGNVNAMNSLRYTYGATGRGLALAMPYPPGMLPSLAMSSAAYGYGGLAGTNKGFHYAMCPCCPTKHYPPTNNEKTTGCLSE